MMNVRRYVGSPSEHPQWHRITDNWPAALLREPLRASWDLLKIMVPFSILVRLLNQVGDVFFSITLTGLCHSLIEDPLVMMALGAHLSGTLRARLLFALPVIFGLGNLLRKVPEKTFGRSLWSLSVGGSEEAIG